MKYTRKQVVTFISILWLLAVTAVSSYAFSRICRFSIPISNILACAATLLPVVAGVLLEGGKRLTRRDKTRPPIVIVANTLILIYSTVVITLLGTHAFPPSALDCGLHERWMSMFSHKDDVAI